MVLPTIEQLAQELPFIKIKGGSLQIHILVSPRSSRAKIIGLHDCYLKIAVSAPPVDGSANQELIKMLSKTFKLAKSEVALVSGEHSRKKIIEVKIELCAGLIKYFLDNFL